MAQLLYITAHPNEENQSFSLSVGKEFCTAYQETNPNDEIIHIDLYKEYIPAIDLDVFSGWGKLAKDSELEHLSAEEQKKVSRLNELCAQFIAADKYVFVNPMWNFAFPPVLKAYIDAICVAGKTFRYTENGPVGLLTDKKAFHIQACGGIYSSGPAAEMETTNRYLGKIMQFIGVPSFDRLFVEGMAAMPEKAESIKQEAIQKAKEMAKTF
ncbi:FMN-dependent NADH-azoreductase [Risungbinella massiliensis]|uniref:FMN-dependent NADH-azoreductase n=1 Tax=Risungbinella massiliensis TaxID=1329796 RepID=UPI0005CC3FAE|nr:FMN-dependent NADH-azoreductase [Risungbinella massiliensis]